MCLYEINCQCVFWLGLVKFGVEGYFGHFVSKGKLVISL